MESASQSSSASTCSCTSTSSMEMDLLIMQQVQFLELDDHPDPLFHWELVDHLDAHHQQHSDSHAPPFASSDDSSVSCFTLPPMNNAPIRHHPHAPHADHHDDSNPHLQFADDYDDEDTHGPQFEDDDSEDDNTYDLNDELVPREVSNKLGRERMRKLGKRAFSIKNNSKRSTTLSPRPGCIRGKHGFGLKHSC